MVRKRNMMKKSKRLQLRERAYGRRPRKPPNSSIASNAAGEELLTRKNKITKTELLVNFLPKVAITCSTILNCLSSLSISENR